MRWYPPQQPSAPHSPPLFHIKWLAGLPIAICLAFVAQRTASGQLHPAAACSAIRQEGLARYAHDDARSFDFPFPTAAVRRQRH